MPKNARKPKLVESESAALEIIDPDLRIIDAHHHLYPPGHPSKYSPEEFLADLNGGHRIEATVFVECLAAYHEVDDPALLPVGETEFVAAALEASIELGGPRIGAGIIGALDLRYSLRTITRALEAHVDAGGGAFRGIRMASPWHKLPNLVPSRRRYPRHMLMHEDFRAGFAELAKKGLLYENWVFFDQLPELADLARSYEGSAIVCNHFGGPVVPTKSMDERMEVFSVWRRNVADLARCENVTMKLGAAGMSLYGFGFDEGSPPSAEMLAQAWRPYVEVCIEHFGAARCMFESNFPADRVSTDYVTLWNAFKLIARQYSGPEQHQLFFANANRVYRLGFE